MFKILTIIFSAFVFQSIVFGAGAGLEPLTSRQRQQTNDFLQRENAQHIARLEGERQEQQRQQRQQQQQLNWFKNLSTKIKNSTHFNEIFSKDIANGTAIFREIEEPTKKFSAESVVLSSYEWEINEKLKKWDELQTREDLDLVTEKKLRADIKELLRQEFWYLQGKIEILSTLRGEMTFEEMEITDFIFAKVRQHFERIKSMGLKKSFLYLDPFYALARTAFVAGLGLFLNSWLSAN